MIKTLKTHAFSTTHMGVFGISSGCESAWSENDVAIGLSLIFTERNFRKIPDKKT